MNDEIAKLREMNNENPVFDHKPTRIPEKEMLEILRTLNFNFSHLYELNYHEDNDIEQFTDKITDNFAIVLNMFKEMGVYPGYFFDMLIQMRIDFEKKHKKEEYDTLRKNFQMYYEMNYGRAVEDGIKKCYYRIQAYSKKNISDAYNDMTQLFDLYTIPHDINTKENCGKTYKEIEYNHVAIMNDLLNSDDIYEDVESMTKLMYEYLSFFVSMGIDPKEMLYKKLFEKETHKKK